MDRLRKRILHFPSEYSAGALSRRRPGEGVWQNWRPACGVIEVSDQYEVALSIKREISLDLSILCSFQADDLQALDLGWTRMKNAQINDILHLAQLEELDIGWTKITDEGLQKVPLLTCLRVLKVGYTSISDASLPNLCRCTRLLSLSLRGTGVTDEGLLSLKPLQTLEQLDLRSTKVTISGVKTIRQLLSPCKILHSHGDISYSSLF